MLADDGVLLHVETDGHGAADNPVIVLVHGFGSSLREFDAQRSTLGDHARLVLYDHRAHGRSGWSGRQRVSLDRLGRDLGTVLDEATDGAPVLLVAHSLGGMAVMTLAVQQPELFGDKVVGVALLSTSGGGLLAEVLPRPVVAILRATGLLRPLLWTLWAGAPVLDKVRPFQRRTGRRWLVRRLFGPPPVPEWATARMESLWAGDSQAIVATFVPALVDHDGAGALPVLATVPSLVLAGTNDATIPYRHSQQIADQLGPGAELVLVDGAGHMVNMTDAEQVNDAVLRLLERVSRN